MKPVVAVFAHPDDEAFGPAGTLAQFVQQGRDVYLICVTDGDAGKNNSDRLESLGQIRREELLASASALGIKQVFFLGYNDGTLSNNLYHEIAKKLQKLITPIQPEILLTMELRGVSGHLDHIAVALITTYIFNRASLGAELWYYCLTPEARTLFADYYIYFPPGYPKEEIDKVVDVDGVWEQKIQAMKAHSSQKHDMERLLSQQKHLPKEECFLIVSRNRG